MDRPFRGAFESPPESPPSALGRWSLKLPETKCHEPQLGRASLGRFLSVTRGRGVPVRRRVVWSRLGILRCEKHRPESETARQICLPRS